MMNRCLLLLTGLLVTVAIVTPQRSMAQGDVLAPTQSIGFLVGPIGGMNAVSYSSNVFPMIESEKDCFTAQNGSDIAPWGGFTVELPLNAQMTGHIVGEILFDSKSSKFTAQNGARSETPTKLNGFEAPGTVATSLSANLTYLLINAAYKYNFTEGPTPVGPGIQVGPSIGMQIGNNFNKTVTVSAASGVSQGDVKSLTATETKEDADASKIRIAMRAQFTYDLPFTQEWVATPTVGYDFPFTSVDNTRGWKASSLFGGVAFRYFLRG
jgi:hypothetical protein